MIDANVRFVRARGVVARRIAGETILVPVTRRAQDMGLFTLNEVGTFVWERLEAAHDLEALGGAVAVSFDVDARTARDDLAPFLSQLRDAGCIEVAS